MVEKVIRPMQNVIDFANYQQARNIATAPSMSPRTCRHCSAVLAEGEREDECSSISNTEEALRWQAAQILRGLI